MQNKLQQFIQTLGPGMFLTENQLPDLVALDRLCPVLVRCGGGRFTAPAQDAAHFIALVEAGGDYVRDVSLPVGTKERAANWVHPHCPVTSAAMLPASFVTPRLPEEIPLKYQQSFSESNCGGVFDGNQVTSDADPGL